MLRNRGRSWERDINRDSLPDDLYHMLHQEYTSNMCKLSKSLTKIMKRENFIFNLSVLLIRMDSFQLSFFCYCC